MSKELDFLKQQGLDGFKIYYGHGGTSAIIWMDRSNGFSSNANRTHLKTHANRLLCRKCILANNEEGTIGCDTVDPNRQGVSWVAEITSDINLTPTYWKTLAGRIPCQPNPDNEYNES